MSSSSSSTFHPGLTFATLVVQFAMTRGSVISSLEPRRKGSGETADTAAPVTPQPSATGNPTGSSSSGQISSGSLTSSIPNTSSTGVPNGSGSSSNTSSSSSTPTSSPSSVARTVIRSDITTAGIVGIAIGSVAILVLALMFLAKCLRRRRQAQGGPTAAFLRVGSSSPMRPQTPVTEMSQTQSSPLISSAVVAGATINPHLPQYSMSNTPASLSPLIFPAASPSLHHSHSLASSSDRSAANTHTSGIHSEVSSPDALSYVSSLRGNVVQGQGILPIISRSVSVTNSAGSGEPVSSISEQSQLHHAMTMYQKSLENDPKGLDIGRMHTDKAEGSEDINDPPPSYDA